MSQFSLVQSLAQLTPGHPSYGTRPLSIAEKGFILNKSCCKRYRFLTSTRDVQSEDQDTCCNVGEMRVPSELLLPLS